MMANRATKPKLQHWVPCFYLRYFSTPESRNADTPLVWALSKDEGKPIRTSVRQLAAQRFLYSPEDQFGTPDWSLEEKFCDLEGTMSTVWPLLADGFTDLYGDGALRKGVALFVSLLYLRHPRRLSEINTLHEQMVKFYDSVPKDETGRPLIDSVQQKGALRPFDTSRWDEYKRAGANEKKRMFVDSIKGHATIFAEILLMKRWSVVFSERPVFITTDTPVAVFNPKCEPFGLATPGTVISFPLSPTRVLMLDDQYDQPEGRYYPLAECGPGPINFCSWRNCERFMISSRHTNEVCAELLASAPETK